MKTRVSLQELSHPNALAQSILLGPPNFTGKRQLTGPGGCKVVQKKPARWEFRQACAAYRALFSSF